MALPVEVNPLLIANRYAIQRSLRFRSSATAYLNRTGSSPTDGTKFTLSFWLKRGSLTTSAAQWMFSGGSTNNVSLIGFPANSDTFQVAQTDSVGQGQTTSAVFRDVSSWYNFILVIDTTQASNTNRILIYVNGVLQTTTTSGTVTQNSTWGLNSANTLNIGRYSFGASSYLDGYLSEIYFIDGQALSTSSFGYYNEIGIWSPRKYGGSYGNNGYYLPFNDPTSATTLCYDRQLGYTDNTKNNWTPNNISVTAGATYDAMTDVPTPNQIQNVAAGNYCIINPLSQRNSSTVANGNLTGTLTAYSAGPNLYGSQSVSSGKYYWEVTYTSRSGNSALAVGIVNNNAGMPLVDMASGSAGVWYYSPDGNKRVNGSATAYGATYDTGDIIGVALDVDTPQITFYKNNSSQGSFSIPSSGTWTPGCWNGTSSGNQVFNANFGQRPFSYTPPSGFLPLNTNNLPTPTISNGAQYMAATTYAGTGSTQPISPGAAGVSYGNNPLNISFAPDFVWPRNRTSASGGMVLDTVRGSSVFLQTTNTNGDATNSGDFVSFNANGFSVGGNGNLANQTSNNYVGWQWQAGGAPTTANVAGAGNVPTAGSVKINGANSTSALAGSIAATNISANTSAGFSVVTYTGTGANATVAHGLGVAPSMVIIKTRTPADWYVGHTSIGWSGTGYLILNNTGASGQYGSLAVWQATAPSPSVISLGTTSGVNASGGNYVAYCWTPISNFSAFGIYTANGLADGPFIFTGFRPRWIMVKATTAISGNWVVIDTTRLTYNQNGTALYPNSTNNEVSTVYVDFLSNGFKIRNSSTNMNNTTSDTYIYAAFAENPFKYANSV